MFLRVDKEVHKMAKLDIGFINSEEMVQRVIFEFEKSLQA